MIVALQLSFPDVELYLGAGIMEVASRHQPIAAVVAWTDQHQNPPVSWWSHPLIPLTGLGDSPAGIFHHRSKGQAPGVSCLLDAAHFVCGHYFHDDFSLAL
jgi:hypothetical protein